MENFLEETYYAIEKKDNHITQLLKELKSSRETASLMDMKIENIQKKFENSLTKSTSKDIT